MTEKSDTLAHQQEIMRLLEFNYRDLEANREGRISHQQGQEIWKREASYWQRLLGLAFAFGLAAICLAPLGISEYRMQEDRQALLWLVGIALLVAVYYLVKALAKLIALHSDISQREVKQIHGVIIHNYVDGNYPRDVFIVNSQKFRSKETILKSLEHLEPYVIHYLPRSKAIVSVEVMEG